MPVPVGVNLEQRANRTESLWLGGLRGWLVGGLREQAYGAGDAGAAYAAVAVRVLRQVLLAVAIRQGCYARRYRRDPGSALVPPASSRARTVFARPGILSVRTCQTSASSTIA